MMLLVPLRDGRHFLFGADPAIGPSWSPYLYREQSIRQERDMSWTAFLFGEDIIYLPTLSSGDTLRAAWRVRSKPEVTKG